jgi:hypothetical protein
MLAEQFAEIVFGGGINATDHSEAQGPGQFRSANGWRFGETGRYERTPATSKTYSITKPDSAVNGDASVLAVARRGDEIFALTDDYGVARCIGSITVDWCRTRKTSFATLITQSLLNTTRPVEVSRQHVASAQYQRNSQSVYLIASCETHAGYLLVSWLEVDSTGNSALLWAQAYDTATGQLVSTSTEYQAVTNGIALRACKYSVAGSEGAVVAVTTQGGAPTTIVCYRWDDATRTMVAGGTLTTDANPYAFDVMTNGTSGFFLAYSKNSTSFLTVETRTIGTVSSTHTASHDSGFGVTLFNVNGSAYVASCVTATAYVEAVGSPGGVVTIATAGGSESYYRMTACQDTLTSRTNAASVFLEVRDTAVTSTFKTRHIQVELDGTFSVDANTAIPQTLIVADAFYHDGRAHVGLCLFGEQLSGFAPPLSSGMIVRTCDNSTSRDVVARYMHDRLSQATATSVAARFARPFVTGNVAHWVSLGDLSPDEITSASYESQGIYWNKVDFDAPPPQWVEHEGATLIASGSVSEYDGMICAEAQPLIRPSVYYGGAAGALSICAIYRWIDAAGRLHRSAPSEVITTFTSGQDFYVGVPPACAYNDGTYREISVEVYVTDGSTSTFYLANVSGGKDDYDALSSDGQWWKFTGVVTGSSANPTLYTTGGVLQSEAPPPMISIARVSDRLFGVDAEDRRRYWYTKPLEEQIAPEWNAVLTGRITDEIVAVANLSGSAVFLCKQSVWILSGEGPDATGRGSYAPPVKVSEVGCVGRNSVAETPYGLAFLSPQGYVILSGGSLQAFGTPVSDVLNGTSTIVRAYYDQNRDELVACTSAYRYTFTFGEGGGWLRHAVSGLVDECLNSSGAVVRGTSSSVAVLKLDSESTTLSRSGSNTWETPWIKLDGIGGFGRLYELLLTVGVPIEVASLSAQNGLVIRFYADYDGTTVVNTWTRTGAEISAWTASVTRQIRLQPKRQQIKAFKLTYEESLGSVAHSGFPPISLGIKYGADPAKKRSQPKAT